MQVRNIVLVLYKLKTAPYRTTIYMKQKGRFTSTAGNTI